MVVFLIPVAVVGYKLWEKRRKEEEEEQLARQNADTTVAATSSSTSSCPDETDSDMIVASDESEMSIVQFSSTASPTTSEIVDTVVPTRQNALLRSWVHDASNKETITMITEEQIILSNTSANDYMEESEPRDIDVSLLRSWKKPSDDEAVVISPIASS